MEDIDQYFNDDVWMQENNTLIILYQELQVLPPLYGYFSYSRHNAVIDFRAVDGEPVSLIKTNVYKFCCNANFFGYTQDRLSPAAKLIAIKNNTETDMSDCLIFKDRGSNNEIYWQKFMFGTTSYLRGRSNFVIEWSLIIKEQLYIFRTEPFIIISL